jgi:hypothetical protein
VIRQVYKISMQNFEHYWCLSSLFFRIVSLLFSLTACSSKPDKIPAPPRNHVDVNPTLEYDTSAIAIIGLDSSKHVIGDHAIASATITQAELAIVDSLVKSYVANYNATMTDDRDLYRIKENYRIQIVTFVNSKGEKEVWVNAFCKASGDYWKTRPVVVFDGGPCYFQVNVNLNKRKIERWFVNGVG